MHLLVVKMCMMIVLVMTVVVLVLCSLHKEHGEADDPSLCLGLLDELFGSEHLS